MTTTHSNIEKAVLSMQEAHATFERRRARLEKMLEQMDRQSGKSEEVINHTDYYRTTFEYLA